MVYIFFQNSYTIYFKATCKIIIVKTVIRHLAPSFTEEMDDSCWVASKCPLLHLCRVWQRDVSAATITIWKRWVRRLPKCACNPALTLQSGSSLYRGTSVLRMTYYQASQPRGASQRAMRHFYVFYQ